MLKRTAVVNMRYHKQSQEAHLLEAVQSLAGSGLYTSVKGQNCSPPSKDVSMSKTGSKKAMDKASQNYSPPVCCCQVWLIEVVLSCSPFQASCFKTFSTLLILLLQQSSSVALSSPAGLVALVTSAAFGSESYLLFLIFRWWRR